MKAIIRSKYGSPEVLKLKEVEKPTPKDNEVLVKVHAASVNSLDWRVLRGEPFMLRFAYGFPNPKIQNMGGDFAGVIEKVGKDVKNFSVGDEVIGDVSDYTLGTFAEFAVADERLIWHKPKNASFIDAATLPVAASTALQGLQVGGINSGMKVLINGAGGGVGTFAVQIAKAMGAEVTAVTKTNKVDTFKSLGTDFVVDYKKEDVAKNGVRYDLIVDVGAYRSPSVYKNSLTKNGKYVMVGGKVSNLVSTMLMKSMPFPTFSKRVENFVNKANPEKLKFLSDLYDSGKIKPVIDKEFSLRQVPEAIRYLESGNVCGKLVIRIVDSN